MLVKGQLASPEEFGAIVLRANPDGSTVRLRDVARIEIGGLSYQFTTRLNGKPTAACRCCCRRPATRSRPPTPSEAKMEELSKFFPSNIKYEIPYDITPVVEASIKKVLMTLIEAVVLVFHGDVPVPAEHPLHHHPDHRGAGGAARHLRQLMVVGFSINMLTMFGMVLAIGILVDDAIVVVENVERIMTEEGLPPREATRKAMTQITGAIIGITLVLDGGVRADGVLPGLGRRHLPPVFRHHGVGHRLLRAPGAVADAGAVRDAAQAGRGRPPSRARACSACSTGEWKRPRAATAASSVDRSSAPDG